LDEATSGQTGMKSTDPLIPSLARKAKPEWLRVRAPGSQTYRRLKTLVRGLQLHTVCEEAHCPNIGECWDSGTATVMILGDTCTRSCGFCAVMRGQPGPVDQTEPSRVAGMVEALGLEYVVITSVTRDDLPDGGASVFARSIREIRSKRPAARVEVLIPDFGGRASALRVVLDAQPDVLNHNTETVARLYPIARPQADYRRSLELLDRSRRIAPGIPVKSGLMVGLGEEWDEVIATFSDLRAAGCAILTLGQYLRPSPAHLPIARYYRPEEFESLRSAALEMGFDHVESGPLVRSSYRAREQSKGT
jgi:lipoyl synthase